MMSLSNIIKKFRVIEDNSLPEENSYSESNVVSSAVYDEMQKKAMEKYDEIILKANNEAEKILDEAYKECDERLNGVYDKAKIIYQENKEKGHTTGFEIGKEEGFNKGYLEGEQEAEKIIDEALNIKKEYINRKNNLLRDSEDQLINLVIAVYEKVLYNKVDEDKGLIESLVVDVVDDLEIKGKLTIIVSEYDHENLEKHKKLILAKTTLIDEIDIRTDKNMDKGDCILETSKGNIDISISKQLDEVNDLILTILKNE